MGSPETPQSSLREERWFLVRIGFLFVLGIALYLGAIVLKSQFSAENNYPRVQLSDGTWLVCRVVTIGKKHELVFPTSLGEQIVRRKRGETETVSTSKQQMVIWLTHENDQNEFYDLNWFKRCELTLADDSPVQPNQYHLKRDQGGHGTSGGGYSEAKPFGSITTKSGRSYVTCEFPVPRSNAGRMQLDIFDGADQLVARFPLPYPDDSIDVPNDWVPDPLPTTHSDGNLSVILKGVTFPRPEKRRGLTVIPQLEFLHDGQPSQTWNAQQELLDQLGNSCYAWECNLSPRESAWKLRLTLSQNPAGRFLPEESKTLDPMAVELAGQASFPTAMNHTVNGVTLSILGLAGPGPVNFTLPGTGTQVISKTFQPGERNSGMSSQCNGTSCKIELSSGQPFMVTNTPWGPDHSIQLVIRDQAGEVLEQRGSTSAQGVAFWFFEPKPTSTSIQLQIIVQKFRRVEFLLAPPPKTEKDTTP
ncbi:MAG: hypothetical protein WCJ09_01690 [Planctomycetota bacterium]